MMTFNAKLRSGLIILVMSSLALIIFASRPVRAAGPWYVAPDGNATYVNGVITWTGPVNAGSLVAITFGATISQTAARGIVITNASVIDNGEEIITRTATVNVPLARVFLPLVSKPGSGLLGHVTLNGADAAGISLNLRYYNGSSWSTLATTTTGADGRYAFTAAPSLSSGQIYYVRFVNPATTADGRLAAWFTRSLTTYVAGDSVDIGDFDLADVTLVSPGPGATVALPTTFHWTSRPATPGDSYQFELFDPGGSSNFLSPLLGYVGSYTLNGLPAGFSLDTAYGWGAFVNSPDGGIGASFYYNPVAFSNGGLTPAQFISTGEQRNSVDLRENLSWRVAP